MFLSDFHVHSTFSDGSLTIAQLVDLYGQHGFGALAVTDHLCEENSFLGKSAAYLGKTLTKESFPLYLETLKQQAERAWRQYSMVLLPGVEITKNCLSNHRSAHVVGIGISHAKGLSADDSIETICLKLRAQNAVTIAAHPVWTRVWERQTFHLWDRREELDAYFDAWEVASGRVIFEEVAQTRLPKIASSDLHQPRLMTSWKTLLHCEKTTEAILEAIRKQQVDFRYFEARSSLMDALAAQRLVQTSPKANPTKELSYA